MEGEHQILKKIDSTLNSSFIKNKTFSEKGLCKSNDILALPTALIFCQFQILPVVFEVQFVSVTVHENLRLVCISPEVKT